MSRRSSIPAKNPSEALKKYWEMRSTLPSRPFVKEAIETGLFRVSREAVEAFNGMLQWLAFHTTKISPSPTIMMSGVVDQMWSLFITSPFLYSEFCERYAGYIVRRVSLASEMTPIVRDCGGIIHTVSGLNVAFEHELSSTLRNWEKMRPLSRVSAVSFTANLKPAKNSDGGFIFDQLWSEE